MAMLVLLSFLSGTVLGMRFKVLVLLPAIACALPIALAVGNRQPGSARCPGVSRYRSVPANWLLGRNCHPPQPSRRAHERASQDFSSPFTSTPAQCRIVDASGHDVKLFDADAKRVGFRQIERKKRSEKLTVDYYAAFLLGACANYGTVRAFRR